MSTRVKPDLRDLMGDEAGLGQKQPFKAGTPLFYCIQQFGGLLPFSRAIGKSTRQIYRWRNSGGLISAEAQTEALIAAKRLGIELDPLRLIYMPPAAGLPVRVDPDGIGHEDDGGVD